MDIYVALASATITSQEEGFMQLHRRRNNKAEGFKQLYIAQEDIGFIVITAAPFDGKRPI